MKNFLNKVHCLSALMGNANLSEIHPYVIKNHRSFARQLKRKFKLEECVILSKCNCVEIYYVSSSDIKDKLISEWKLKSSDNKNFKKSAIYEYVSKKTIEHLFETACGLKSVTLGDNQVVGQVRQAISLASEDKTAGIILKTVFNNARKVSNTVRNTTDIGKGNVSAERTTVEMMTSKIKSKESLILIVGAGSTGSLLCKALSESGYKNITIANRSLEKADDLVKHRYAQKAMSLEEIKKLKQKPSVIFYATSNVFTKIDLKYLESYPKVLIFDLGTPQNTMLVKNKYEIYTIESINEFSLHNKKLRQDSVSTARDIISTHLLKTIDAITFRLKEETRRKNFHTNNDLYKSKIDNIKLKSDAYFEVRKELIKMDFVEVHTPTITAVPTDPVRNDPGEEIFSVNWFGRKMLLRQSNQLYKQILALSGMKKLFEIGPFWRAEQNPTARHLSEAYGLDIEMSDISEMSELLDILKKILNKITVKLFEEGKINKHDVVVNDIKTITYEDAINLLNKEDKTLKVRYGIDFGYDLEGLLGKIVKTKYHTDLFAIIKYPSSVKKFYTKRAEDDKTYSFDVIYKGWEIVSGAIRETEYERLLEGIKETGLKYQKYQFYLNAFKNPVSHGGFCLGIDRFLIKLLNLNSLSDLVLFPRSEYDIIP